MLKTCEQCKLLVLLFLRNIYLFLSLFAIMIASLQNNSITVYYQSLSTFTRTAFPFSCLSCSFFSSLDNAFNN